MIHGTEILSISLPVWVAPLLSERASFPTVDSRMALAIELSRQNVSRGTGGPFGAAVFERDSGRLVAVGVNSVVRLNNCALHAELLAFQLAQHRLGVFSLAAPGLPEHELVTSCEPCAMCLGGTMWSGVRRLVCGATREDATRLNFEEGPVFPESWRYLEARGIEIVKQVRREEARAVLEMYRQSAGQIYNG